MKGSQFQKKNNSWTNFPSSSEFCYPTLILQRDLKCFLRSLKWTKKQFLSISSEKVAIISRDKKSEINLEIISQLSESHAQFINLLQNQLIPPTFLMMNLLGVAQHIKHPV